MYYNGLEELVEQKYKDVNQVRLEYPHVVQTFKNSRFPPEILSGLSLALDDLGEVPIIVRSSSLLEDRLGAVFSGKYKSLFLANQGTKPERLAALCDAISEVYASTFSPDAMQYRAERGLLDYDEEMGIMIQQVVGTKVGHYFMPSYAGVAFSRNEFRWSPRIKREDGLIRLVPGLGTRAVDRLSDDYPVLIAPGQPRLRVNVTIEESIRYSPRFVDVINLEKNKFETIPAEDLLRKYGHEIPGINDIVSIRDGDRLRHFLGLHVDFHRDQLLVTFEGVAVRSNLISRIKAILRLLEQTLGQPVDIEFASDGRDFYLLQYRPQSSTDAIAGTPIPRDVPRSNIVFSAHKYVSNGRVPDIMYIVYVVPEAYSQISDRSLLTEVGHAIGALNKYLPHRQFILIGPGRWGSRGDVRLGVSVTYSDINNTAMLIEVARKKGNYVPDLSFGTHFFQDLVESGIRYLPLYPDEPGVIFHEAFLTRSQNFLAKFAPEYTHLDKVIRVIDVRQASGGYVLRVAMNADTDEAIGYIARSASNGTSSRPTVAGLASADQGDSEWRILVAEKIAFGLHTHGFGVLDCWLTGSAVEGTSGPKSDIDLLMHFQGTTEQRTLLELWLDGWNSSLSEINYLRTGIRVENMLDIQFLSDEEVANKTGNAAKIDAKTNPALLLTTKSSPNLDH
jgi:predicted nucleotidyltransferase